MTLTATDVQWLNAFSRSSPGLPPPDGAVDGGADGGGGGPADPTLDQLKLRFAAQREDEEVADTVRRAKLLNQALSTALGQGDVMHAAFDFQMGTALNKQTALDVKHGNQENEIDAHDLTRRAAKGAIIKIYGKGKTGEQVLADAKGALTILVKEGTLLASATTMRSQLNLADRVIEARSVALFDDAEIASDYWGALKRARLVSDSMVQNRFSGTQRMLDAVGDLYVENELAGATNGIDGVKDITKGIANLGGGIATLVTSSLGVDTAMVKDLIEAGTTLAQIGMDAGAMAFGLEQRDMNGLIDQVPKLMGNLVGQFAGKEVGDVVARGASLVVGAAQTGVKALQGQPVTAEEVGALFNEMIQGVLESAVAGVGGDKEGAGRMLALMSTAAGAIDLRKMPKLVEGVRRGDYKLVASGVLSVVADVVAVGGQLAAQGATVAGKQLSDDLAGGIDQGGQVAGEAIALASSLLLAESPADVAAQLEAAVPTILGDITAAVAGPFDLGKGVADALGAQVAAQAGAAFGFGALVAGAAKGEAITAERVGKLLEQCIGVAVSGADAALAAQGTPAAAAAQQQVDVVGQQLASAAKAFGQSADAQALLTGQKGERQKAAGKLVMLLLLSMPAAGSAMAEAAGDTKAAGGLDEAAKAIETLQEAAAEARTVVVEADEQIAAIEQQLADARAAALVEEADAIVDEAAREREAWKAEVRAGLQPGGDGQAIMKAIAEMKRNDAIMKAAIAVGSAGAEVAAQFFAPMAIAGQLLKMTAHIAIAVQRAIDLKRMLDGRTYAESGSSAYRSAIDNFVQQQGAQLTEHSIQAAMCALRAASEAASLAHPAGKAAAVGVSLAQQGVNVGVMVYKEAEKRKAWSVTKAWLSDRNNRRAGLKAQRLNPTLAKYALAYGATEARDPVACKVMNDIGLTNQMLQSEEAGVVLVKTWLEARFSEDQKISFQWETTEAWQKTLPEPKLTQQSLFSAFATMGEAGRAYFVTLPPALATPPNAMVGALNRYDDAARKLADARRATRKVQDDGRQPDASTAALTAWRQALTAETAALREVLRLAQLFIPEAGKLAAAVNGLPMATKAMKEYPRFKAGVLDVVVAYRALMEDEAEGLQMDLLKPSMDLLRVQAKLDGPAARQQLAA